MPTYKTIVPNYHANMQGAGLVLAGSGMDGGAFGKGTQRKVFKGAKKVAKISEALLNEFGNEKQKAAAAKARKATDIITGGAHAPPGAKLRAMIQQQAKRRAR
jgi:hypothetical protein